MFEFDVDGSTAIVTLGAEGKFNPDSLAQFNRALDAVVADETIQVLMITGAGKHFSQGLDLEYVMSVPDTALDFVGDCLKSLGRLLTFPVPVVSLVNGHAFGLGAMITLASDYKVMREDRGYFCLPEADLGMSLTYRMNALVTAKLDRALLRDILLTARRISGPEAKSLGIVDEAVPLEELYEQGLALAKPMTGKSRSALSGLKRGINLDVLRVIESDEVETTIPGM